MFLIPYGTNAPIYHWPIATVGLIVINVVVFALSIASPESVEPFILAFGDGFHPVQWITSNFLHADIFHLIGNMLFLWAFGIIVEGKLGAVKMLAVYLGIGLLENSVVQLMMIDSQGGALGASGVIFGLMMICLVWAPENEIFILFVVFFRFMVRASYFEVKVSVFAGLFLLLQIVIAVVTKMSMSSELLHLIGAAAGLPFALILLKTGMVDCENWDLFSVIAGRHQMTDDEREQDDARRAGKPIESDETGELPLDVLLDQLREIIRAGQLPLALGAYRRLAIRHPGLTLPREDLWDFIQALHKQKKWSDSIPMMEEYLKHYPRNSEPMRMKLGQILLVEKHHPPQALNVLNKVDPKLLNTRQREFLAKLKARAKSQLFGVSRMPFGSQKRA